MIMFIDIRREKFWLSADVVASLLAVLICIWCDAEATESRRISKPYFLSTHLFYAVLVA